MSSAQQRIWFISKLESNSPTYNVFGAFRLMGCLDCVALEQGLQNVVLRHEILRTTYKESHGKPLMSLIPDFQIMLSIVDLASTARDKIDDEVLKLAADEAGKPFDLATGPLIRACLVKLNDEHHILLLSAHHIVFDGWSVGLFFQELAASYREYLTGQPSSLPLPRMQYSDFAAWQHCRMQTDAWHDQLLYWRHQLEGAPAFLDLHTDYPRQLVQSHRGATHFIEIPLHLLEALRELSRREHVTLFMTLLAAFDVLLYGYTGQEDIVVGSPIANRNRVELEGLIGMFVNTLAIRVNIWPHMTFTDLLKHVRDVTLSAYANQDLPFEKVVDDLCPTRCPGVSPLFNVMFILQDSQNWNIDIPGIAVESIPVDNGTAKFDLVVELSDANKGINGTIVYNTDLFCAATIALIAERFIRLLSSIVADANSRICMLPIAEENEQESICSNFNDDLEDA